MAYTFEHIDTKRFFPGMYPNARTISSDGKIHVHFGSNSGNKALYTENYGDDWEVIDKSRFGGFIELHDGSFLSVGFQNSVCKELVNPKAQEKIPYVLKIVRASSMDDIKTGNLQTEFCLVDIPDLAIGYGDSGDSDNYHTGGTCGFIQAPNGDIFVAMYGQFKSDKTKLDYFKNYDFYQYRTWIIVSHDNGKTFEFLSTVADCQTYPYQPEAEGFCEPELLFIENEHLICVMRTQGHEVYTPMYVSHSYDMGKTWSSPEEINPYGVLPRLIKLSNGAVVLASGKWDTFLQISDDNGKTWSSPYVIKKNDGQWDKGPSGYVSLFETNPCEILVVYDHTEDTSPDFPKPEERRILFASRYKVIEK